MEVGMHFVFFFQSVFLSVSVITHRFHATNKNCTYKRLAGIVSQCAHCDMLSQHHYDQCLANLKCFLNVTCT